MKKHKDRNTMTYIYIVFYVLVCVSMHLESRSIYIYIHIYIYLYIFFELILVQEQSGSHYYSIVICFMGLRPLWAGALPNRIDMEAFEDYDRLLTVNYMAMQGPLAAVPMAEPEFEGGLFMVIHAHGLLINSEWSHEEGGPRGYLQFGETFAVVDVSMHHEDGRVRARVERWDGLLGYISVYNTRCMQHFVASMEGQPPWFRPRDLLRELIEGLQQPRLPLAAPPLAFESF